MPNLWCTYQPLFSRLQFRLSIPTSRQTLCWKICFLIVWSRRKGTLQYPFTRENQSGFHWKCRLLLRYCILLSPKCQRQHLSPYIPISVHWIYRSLICSTHSEQGFQHDSLLFRINSWINSSRWTKRYWSSTSKISLSDYFRLHKLDWDLNSTWHCSCNIISCLIQKCSPLSTLQGGNACSQIYY